MSVSRSALAAIKKRWSAGEIAPCVGDAEGYTGDGARRFLRRLGENFGAVSTFSRSGDKFMVRTDGPDEIFMITKLPTHLVSIR